MYIKVFYVTMEHSYSVCDFVDSQCAELSLLVIRHDNTIRSTGGVHRMDQMIL